MRAGFDLNKQQPQQLTKQNIVNFHAAHLLDPNEHPNNSLNRIDETGGERKASVGPREGMEEEDDHIEVWIFAMAFGSFNKYLGIKISIHILSLWDYENSIELNEDFKSLLEDQHFRISILFESYYF